MTVLEAHIAFKIEADKNAVNIGISGLSVLGVTLMISARQACMRTITLVEPSFLVRAIQAVT